tara:strand:+ start:480 stop:848 length:369 start_codon:yes stop_codon:yes gene_type:complete
MVEVAGILIHYKNEVLLFQRSNKVRYNGSWSVPGGHIERNESTEGAAKRETFEETMIMIAGPIKEIGIYDDRYVLFSKELDSKTQPVIDEEHSDWGWFDKDKLPSPIAPFVEEAIGEIYAES